MCGIVGYVGNREVVPLLLEGLSKLEYRGYDSAGVVVVENGAMSAVRAEGKLSNLREKLQDGGRPRGTYGLGHTRWATHGPPSERNAHPVTDQSGKVAIIHNGIIENFLDLKQELQEDGCEFSTDTDTEVVANLVARHLSQVRAEGGDEPDALFEAVRRTVGELEGMYAFAAVTTATAQREVVAARQGPPLALGLGNGEQFLASDPAALLAHTKDVIFLENGDLARITEDEVRVFDVDGQPLDRQVQRLNWDPVQTEKGGYKHYMLKEIHEQSQAIQDTLGSRMDFERRRISFGELDIPEERAKSFERVHILACGTSWHSGLVAKFVIEELTRLPVEVDYGSEYRYRDPVVDENVLAIGISQSGETADTLSAMEAAQEKGAYLVAVCNVRGSEATRVSDGVVYTHAGPEIGVASTKAFTTQLVALHLLALYLRQQRGHELEPEQMRELTRLPKMVDEVLRQEKKIKAMARRYHRARDFLYLGRGINYPIALEGALKLKEISYIHAEGYPAGEMKHGPIALIDEDMPVVAIATGDHVYEKVEGNVQEVKARDGIVIALTDRENSRIEELADDTIVVPRTDRRLQPIINVVPLQLFAYYVGVRRGADVDQPRNLAKSVTVE
jgi:glutamine---fructose-6-phosphate transaminase (isomerizing)